MKQFERFENHYRALITEISSDPWGIIQFGKALQEVYQKTEKEINTLQRLIPSSNTELNDCFKAYYEAFSYIHKANMDWISLYADFCWPTEKYLAVHSKKEDNQRLYYQKQAEQAWRQLEENSRSGKLLPCEQDIFNLNILLKDEIVNSKQWRVLFQDLSQKIYNRMCSVLIESKYTVKNLFVILLYRRSSSHISEIIFIPDHISDCLHGYIQNSNKLFTFIKSKR